MSNQLPIRVWYTIDGSSQYLLARSLEKQSITFLDPPLEQNGRVHGTVMLRSCLDIMCTSSPELLHDVSRDFSVYVLDPTETQLGPVTQCSSTVQALGVAVGMGLMSALLTDSHSSAAVPGTVTKQSSGNPALEVVFALRGITRMTNYQAAPAFWQNTASRASTTGMLNFANLRLKASSNTE
ncbi:hypothetical protein K488DRAFT_88175 [Vararia minispora EC-137]|uniref:Uncharacterized protein n=1 Tax=Vararia minispora EC-137 TaxID=1314806 RepID=A0ACB8QEJ5_9AGAM|nr:hypothetical protein K488DRAFT_88175 [Vararia minispora EC-137]